MSAIQSNSTVWKSRGLWELILDFEDAVSECACAVQAIAEKGIDCDCEGDLQEHNFVNLEVKMIIYRSLSLRLRAVIAKWTAWLLRN
jgi:hypothetical protein